MDTQLEVMVAAQKLVLEDQYRQLAAYQRTVLRLLRLFERTDVPSADIQRALAEIAPAAAPAALVASATARTSAADLVAQAVEGQGGGNA